MSSEAANLPKREVLIARQYQIVNESRIVVFRARDQFALVDTEIAVPFGLLKYLAGSLSTAEGRVEMARLGMVLNETVEPAKPEAH